MVRWRMRQKSRFGIILGQEPHFPTQGWANQRRARARSVQAMSVAGRRSRVSQLPPVGRAFLLLPRLRVWPSQLPYPLRSFLHVASPAALSLLLGRSTANIHRAVAVSPPSPIPLLCSAFTAAPRHCRQTTTKPPAQAIHGPQPPCRAWPSHLRVSTSILFFCSGPASAALIPTAQTASLHAHAHCSFSA